MELERWSWWCNEDSVVNIETKLQTDNTIDVKLDNITNIVTQLCDTVYTVK